MTDPSQTPSTAPRVQTVVARGGRNIPLVLRTASALRRRATSNMSTEQHPKRGMWVVLETQTGILTNLEPGDVATVMLVNEDGLNVVEVHVPAAALRQAHFDEIPAPRRPSEELAAAMGYTRLQ